MFGAVHVRLFVAALVALAFSLGARVVVDRVFPYGAEINVRWAPAVDDRVRAESERALRLTEGRALGDRTWAYVLVAPTIAKVRRIVEYPAVEDTSHIDRDAYRVEPSAERGAYFTTRPRWIPVSLRVASPLLGALTAAIAGVVVLRLVAPYAAALTVSLGLALAFLWTQYIAGLHTLAARADGWSIGDWLASYDLGFARRGLLGSPLLWIAEGTGASPEWVVFGFVALLYTAFLVGLFLLLRNKQLNIWFVALLFSPAALLFPAYTDAAIGRKELLFFAIFTLYVWRMPRPTLRACLIAGALGGAATLSHELFLFFTPYFFVARLLHGEPPRHRYAFELSVLGGSVLALLLVSTAGSNMRAADQCDALVRQGYPASLCDGVLRYAVDTVAGAIDDTIATAKTNRYVPLFSIAAVLGVLPFAAFWLMPGRRRLAPAVPLAVAAALAFSAPLFAVAIDWGRWINIHALATTILLGGFALHRRTSTLIDGQPSGWDFFGVSAVWLQVVIALAVGWYLTGWAMGHCCSRIVSLRWLPY